MEKVVGIYLTHIANLYFRKNKFLAQKRFGITGVSTLKRSVLKEKQFFWKSEDFVGK